MKTLKNLKDALNKLPDDKLESFFITHNMSCEDCDEPGFSVSFVGEEEEYEELRKLYRIDGYEVLRQFTEELNRDLKKIAICMIDIEKMDDYTDDCPNFD
jgi:hypothetical protein